MTTFRPVFAYVALSVAVHTMLGSPFYFALRKLAAKDKEAVEVSLVQIPPAPPQIQYRKEKPAEKPAPVKKQPAPVSAARKIESRCAFHFHQHLRAKRMKEKIPANKAQIKSLSSSQELTADPQKGAVFLNYFAAIKAKIQETIEKKYADQNVGQGTVALIFVLTQDGRLERAFVVDKDSRADDAVKSFATESLRASAPFAPFPKEIPSDRISFNIAVSFQEF